MTISTLKGFFEELGFMRKRKRKYHTLVSGASMFHSPSLFLCPRLPAIPLRLLLQGPTQQTCFLPLASTILSGGSPSQLSQFLLLHLLTCALISQRSDNTAVLFKLYCTRLSHLRAVGKEGLPSLYCVSYTSAHNVTGLQLRKKLYMVQKLKARRREGGMCVYMC